MVFSGSAYMRVFAKTSLWGSFLRVGLYARSVYMRVYREIWKLDFAFHHRKKLLKYSDGRNLAFESSNIDLTLEVCWTCATAVFQPTLQSPTASCQAAAVLSLILRLWKGKSDLCGFIILTSMPGSQAAAIR